MGRTKETEEGKGGKVSLSSRVRAASPSSTNGARTQGEERGRSWTYNIYLHLHISLCWYNSWYLLDRCGGKEMMKFEVVNDAQGLVLSFSDESDFDVDRELSPSSFRDGVRWFVEVCERTNERGEERERTGELRSRC